MSADHSYGCPNCMRHFWVDSIFECENYHNICNKCRRDRFVCPICKGQFTGRRNTLLEQVCRDRLGIQQDSPEVYGPQNLKHNLFIGPPRDIGYFPCRVPECNANLPICRIVNHCRSVHANLFREMHSDIDILSTVPIEDFTMIYQSSKHGLIYLRCHVTQFEGARIIHMWAQVAASEKSAKDVRYKLKLNTSGVNFKFSDIPHSTRISEKKVLESGRYLLASTQEDEVMSINIEVKKNKGPRSHRRTGTYTVLSRPFAKVPV